MGGCGRGGGGEAEGKVARCFEKVVLRLVTINSFVVSSALRKVLENRLDTGGNNYTQQLSRKYSSRKRLQKCTMV